MSRSFEDRHIGPTSVDEAAMLKSLGYSDLPSFISDVVPSNIAINGVIEALFSAELMARHLIFKVLSLLSTRWKVSLDG